MIEQLAIGTLLPWALAAVVWYVWAANGWFRPISKHPAGGKWYMMLPPNWRGPFEKRDDSPDPPMAKVA